ncbi:MAG: MjaI family restriction endonuclease [Candidatus Omnitrophica bacterium]|nr:MjaI family restriction endonuclease [Candidatus Omnitrophota bacterium]
MAKEWILNIATNRWGLNKKSVVGPVAHWIRECAPKTLKDWEIFYYKRLSQMLKQKNINLPPKEYLQEIGKKLYTKITEVIQAEIEEVEEKDCIDYIKNLVIFRTYDGYSTEIKTIYGQLKEILKISIEPAPDKWDRLYNVDFYIKINDKYIGLQIKPITYEQTPEIHKWKEWISKTHKKFEKEIGGKVFIVFSVKKDGKKIIYNSEVINEINKEIMRLKKEK